MMVSISYPTAACCPPNWLLHIMTPQIYFMNGMNTRNAQVNKPIYEIDKFTLGQSEAKSISK
jgi:hypothetical protein